jgi:class 3 adenylate cyclase
MAEVFSFGAWVRRRRKALDLTQLAASLELPVAEHEAFLKVARAEQAVDQLATPPLAPVQTPLLTTVPLPTGTLTFLFTDLEGSTTLWEHNPKAMQRALVRHDGIVRRHSPLLVASS